MSSSAPLSTHKFDNILPYLPDDIEAGGVLSATSLLQQKASEVRQQRVNWHFYRSGDFISQAEFDWIVKYENLESVATRDEFIKSNPMLCAEIFLSLLEKLSKNQATQYILIIMDDLLNEDKSRVEIFKEYCKKEHSKKDRSIWRHLEHQLNKSDGLIQNMAARIITKIACWSKEPLEGTDLQLYMHWLIEQMKVDKNEYLGSVARCLQMMLRNEDYRQAFIAADGISAISNTLSSGVNFQIQYQLTFCLWLLSFNPKIADKMSRGFSLIPPLADILSESVKEKVTRIILATFRNLIEKPTEPDITRDNAITMVQRKVLKQLEIFTQAGNKYEDPDLLEDIEFLLEKLQTYVQDLSSFDEYSNEVKSGRLEWSPVHSNEKFWRENAKRLNEKNHELLRMLIEILKTIKDPLILSVAIHDIGEYVRYYPQGKTVIDKLNGKFQIMQLMVDNDPNVKYEALLCVQKLVVHNWEYLGRQIEKDVARDKKPVTLKA
ncbi:V-type proton ATPase subunit VhaSFD isoform X2 [Brevipalpus obovatus]|uniref:V-type proton ATPase subunit VhaSFD isoform X2 n=1 Tax=Brevipalpus obovatus TaxID=246614 RepID=UPI003D9F473F